MLCSLEIYYCLEMNVASYKLFFCNHDAIVPFKYLRLWVKCHFVFGLNANSCAF
jgi:hypothetical protein